MRIKRGPLAPLMRWLGYADYATLPRGISYAGAIHPTADVRFLADLTWIDEDGRRRQEQEIFDAMLDMIRRARRLVILDLFLFNDLLISEGDPVRPLCRELTDALVQKKREAPDIVIYFITDPCNTVYKALPSVYFRELKAAGIPVVISDVDKLRDSNPVYTFLWRLLVRPLGNSPGGLMPHPFGGNRRISLRSYLTILNIKANHRKTVLADDGDDWAGLVTTANPHDASCAHRNVGVRFSGPAVADLYETEKAVLAMSGQAPPTVRVEPRPQSSDTTLQILTEGRIKDGVLEVIDRTVEGDRLDIVLFYLADRDVLRALTLAAGRRVAVRLILDPNKDAFGFSKSGIPNRPVAYRLKRHGIEIRWADTHGEQCHSKVLCANLRDGHCVLIQGSANFTRRNIDDFNLETDVRIEGPATSPALARANEVFEASWSNAGGRRFTVDYAVYEETSPLQHWLYWFMETTGISTF